MSSPIGYRHLLARYLAPQWKRAAILLVLMLVGVGLELANPQIIRRFIDSATAGAALSALLMIGGAFLVVALLGQLVLVYEQYMAGNVAWSATNRLRADLTLHCLSLDLSYHGAHPPGELVERVDGDVAKLSEFFSQFLVRLVGNFLLLIGILLLSFGIEWRVGLALTLFALVALAVLSSLSNVGAKAWEKHSRASAGLFGFLEEYLSGTEDLRANGGNAFALRRLAEQQRNVLRTVQRAVLLGGLPWSSTTLLLTIGTVIGLTLGAYLYRAGTITIGSVYLIFAYTELLRRPLEEIGRQIQQLQQASASVARIRELLAVQPRINDGPGRALVSGALPMTFEGVTFWYEDEDENQTRDTRHETRNDVAADSVRPDETRNDVAADRVRPDETRNDVAADSVRPDETRNDVAANRVRQNDISDETIDKALESIVNHQPSINNRQSSINNHQTPVLHNVSFTLEPGEVLGLLGRTGSGKTTMARLIFRFFDPQHGAIKLADYDLRELQQSQIRQHVGLVTQDIQLFHASVRDNLTFFDTSIPDERIVAVLEELGLHRWFNSLPDGLQTRLAPDGGGLSAGEAQLLAFARVFLRNPGLVILDEASSRLDPATERALERAVDRLLNGRTAIIIAHRLPTVQRADKVLILERGEIVEFGRRTELLAQPESRFVQLLRTGMEEALA